jgi:hypothetical protein
MWKAIPCPHCGHQFKQQLPDVTAADADRLKANDDDRGVVFPCPLRQNNITMRQWDLPDLPDAS